MTLKETLDKLTELVRFIQFANASKDQIAKQVEETITLIGQVIVQKDSLNEELQKYFSHLWVSHIKGTMDCPECRHTIPLDFYFGSKGLTGKIMSAASEAELIEKLEFPPIQVEDLASCPIPDYMPPEL